MKQSEIIYLTNLPSFYKINLLNEINKKRKILAIFTGTSAQERNADFFSGDIQFDYISLPAGKVKQFATLIKVLRQIKYSELMVGGWEDMTETIAPFFSRKRKNSVIIESSYHECKASGIKGLIKRLILSRYSKAYVPGSANAKVCELLKFKGKVVETKGVGVFNYHEQPPFSPCSAKCNKILYVGRLSPEKNLPRLIEVVNLHPEWELTIVGFGPQENELKAIAGSNIHFTGAVANKEIAKYYQSSDVFVLPSTSETWGLVVEEALNNGCPVAVTEIAGCAETWVADGRYGVTFNPLDKSSIEQSLTQILNPEVNNSLRRNIARLDFEKIEQEQINCYI